MNRNKLTEIDIISRILASENNADEIKNFIIEMLTKSELETLSKRWRILEMLSEKRTQRSIAEALHVSLCKVTRGSQILKNKKSIVFKYLQQGVKNDSEI